ncbi:unnamed protein product [Miscanthus lutarioriparius]|uniref:Uncharacterized protein n=1 Tax=Miscanthus lutarioriparius TaxID=422564 RepID=A0A811Q5A3_9POAL|nr:unnamed protein product [Miscanthus lutarioriparius]
MEPLRNSLGKFRDENNAMRAQSAGLCSSIEELDLTIKMLNDRMVHESIPLSEEKRLVKIIGEGIDGIKKERQAVRSKIKVLEDELKLVDAEIASLQEDLDAATARKDKAYESLQELRAVRDAKDYSFYNDDSGVQQLFENPQL